MDALCQTSLPMEHLNIDAKLCTSIIFRKSDSRRNVRVVAITICRMRDLHPKSIVKVAMMQTATNKFVDPEKKRKINIGRAFDRSMRNTPGCADPSCKKQIT